MTVSSIPQDPASAGSCLEGQPVTASITARLDALAAGRWPGRLAAVVGVGSFFNFYEVALGTLLIPLLPREWTSSTLRVSSLISATFAGEFVGAIVLSRAADRVGRRRMLQINLVAYAAASLLAATAWSAPVLIFIRVLIGIGLGAELTLVDTYLAELLPTARRGRLMIRSYVFASLAVPVAGILATRLPHSFAGMSSWRWLSVIGAFGALAIWILRRRLPESPRWLAVRGRTDLAHLALAAIEAQAGCAGSPWAEPQQSGPAETREPDPRLPTKAPRTRLALVCVIQVISPIGFYGFASIAPLVLRHKGFSVVDSLGYSALTAIGYPAGALLLTAVVERFERRAVIVAAGILVAISGLVFGLGDSPPVIVAAGTVCTVSNVMQATTARAYAAELFPTSIRNTVLGRTYALSRLVSAILPFAALAVLDALGAVTLYAFCGALMAVLALTVAVTGPRTNARQLEAI